MNIAQRRFARREEQLPPLLQHDVCCAMNEVVAQAVRDCRQRPHAARHDRHPHRQERAARNRCALIVRCVRHRRKALNLIDGVCGFVEQRRRPHGLMTRCVSTPASRSISSSRTP